MALLIILARYPTTGKVKTRLAAALGHRAATAAYRHLLGRCAREFADTPFGVEWWYTPAKAPFRRIVGRGAVIHPQPAGDLGQRMAAAFAAACARGHDRVVLIGTDAPEVDRATVRRALRLLARHPVVLQPTADGGYALIGMRRAGSGERGAGVERVFRGIPWGTARVMARTRARLRRLGLKWAELPQTYDVDTVEDWERYGRAVA
jgi:uncharacterized protein